jgi:hypothetical protein
MLRTRQRAEFKGRSYAWRTAVCLDDNHKHTHTERGERRRNLAGWETIVKSPVHVGSKQNQCLTSQCQQGTGQDDCGKGVSWEVGGGEDRAQSDEEAAEEEKEKSGKSSRLGNSTTRYQVTPTLTL